mmetsp:Transcript_124601/g.360397  ORF Transcript_124601/g.360397 Transcript_124601/m.360397 type:complete len:227 (-) Transcript_124601:1084-1764(-)
MVLGEPLQHAEERRPLRRGRAALRGSRRLPEHGARRGAQGHAARSLQLGPLSPGRPARSGGPGGLRRGLQQVQAALRGGRLAVPRSWGELGPGVARPGQPRQGRGLVQRGAHGAEATARRSASRNLAERQPAGAHVARRRPQRRGRVLVRGGGLWSGGGLRREALGDAAQHQQSGVCVAQLWASAGGPVVVRGGVNRLSRSVRPGPRRHLAMHDELGHRIQGPREV